MHGMTGIEAAGTVTETATAIGMCAVTHRVTHRAIRAAMDVPAAISARDARAPGSRTAIQAGSVTRHVTRHRGPAKISH